MTDRKIRFHPTRTLHRCMSTREGLVWQRLGTVQGVLLACAVLLGVGCGDGSAPPIGDLATCVYGSMTGQTSYGCSDSFLLAHNGLREDLNLGNVPGQPVPSTDLTDMTRDLLLEQVAGDHAVRCRLESNANRTEEYQALGGTADTVGENLYWIPAPGAPPSIAPGAVDEWSSSYVDYDYASNTCSPGADCGTYTQIAWAETTGLGCAAAYCTELDLPSGTQPYAWLVVCNYAPGGNVAGQSPY